MSFNPIKKYSSLRLFLDSSFKFTASLEQTTGAPFDSAVHNDGRGIPTIGYGYAMIVVQIDLVTKQKIYAAKSALSTDLISAGIAYSVAAQNAINSIVANLNSGASVVY